MKIFKKTISLLAVASMMLSVVTTASAGFTGITLKEDKKTVVAGETFEVVATFDTLIGAKGLEIEFVYDDDAFSIDTTNNEDYNFGTNKKPVYYPNYVIEDMLSNFEGEMAIYNAWGSLSYNNYASGDDAAVKYLSTDTDSGYIIKDGDEDEDMYPYKSAGVILTAADNIAAGTYDIVVKAIVSDSTVGDIVSTKTMTITVEGEEEEVSLVAGVDSITTPGKHNGKASFSASAGIATTGLTKITVKNSTDADRVEEWEAPATYGDGISMVLPIVTYNKVAELINSIFTVEFYNEDGVFKTLTYKVQ